MTKIRVAAVGGTVLAALIAGCGGGSDSPTPTTSQPASPKLPQEACSALVGMTIPAASIGLPTSGALVQNATLVDASADGNSNGEYCAVKGQILPVSADAPTMEYQVNLPTTWNNKVLQLGGGGYDGSLVTGLNPFALQPATVTMPLKQGYVTLGSDGGHKGGPGFDGRFGLNDEALLNYGKQSVKKTHDVAMAIVKARYGTTPKRFYFIGGSQGGHEALDAAARYAADYDGVVANYPAYNVTMLHLGALNLGKALYANGGAGWMNATKTKLLTDAVYAACDGLDGVSDGIISNVGGCNAAFNITTVRSTLRCLGGTDTGDTCLSDAQIDAVDKIASPYRPGFPIAGMSEYPRWALLEGARYTGASTFGTRPVPTNPPSAALDAFEYSAGAATTQYIITRNPSLDPLTFDPLQWQARTQEVGTIMDVSNVDLAPFRDRGGKLILVHGTIDDLISPHNTEAYYEYHKAIQGQAAMDSFVRFYTVPGLGHGFGTFNAKYDGLGLLDNWVEHGQAPGTLTAVDGNTTGATAGRTRPMCQYPAWPKFTGASGASPNDEANFTCVTL